MRAILVSVSNKIFAAIDIGSNTINLVIKNRQSLEILYESVSVVGLGRGVQKTSLLGSIESDNALNVLCDYAKEINKFNIQSNQVLVSGTEALRRANNSKEFIQKVKNKTGLTIKIITADAEAYFSSLGTLESGHNEKTLLDIGGASTEIIRIDYNPFNIVESISFPFGSVLVSEWSDQEFNSKISELSKSRVRLMDKYNFSRVVGIAGTMTSLVCIAKNLKEFKREDVEGFTISKNNLENILNKLPKCANEILHLYPILGKRSKTIRSGLKIACYIANVFKVETIIVSTYGLRHGLVYEGTIDEKYIFKG